MWEENQFSFPEAADFSTWEQMIFDMAEDNFICP